MMVWGTRRNGVGVDAAEDDVGDARLRPGRNGQAARLKRCGIARRDGLAELCCGGPAKFGHPLATVGEGRPSPQDRMWLQAWSPVSWIELNALPTTGGVYAARHV